VDAIKPVRAAGRAVVFLFTVAAAPGPAQEANPEVPAR
jgi:hypothetical protein